jgi:small subunit ribosomal protein S2
VVAILDSNSDPAGINYPIPGNDDALRAIQTYCDLISGAVLNGIQAEMARGGVYLGEQAEAPVEDLGDEEVAVEAVPEAEASAEQPTA